ncbi:MAG: CARDB domain-containing protein [Verrucomicrobiia bacterium]
METEELIQDSPADAGRAVGLASLDLAAQPSDDSVATAQPLELKSDPTIPGLFVGNASDSLDPANDVDYWGFSALAGDLVAVSVDTPNSGLEAYTRLTNSADGVVDSDNDSGPYSDDLISYYRVPTSGTYYVRVAPHGASTGGYDLTVILARGMDLESDRDYINDAPARASPVSFTTVGATLVGRVAGTVMFRQGGRLDVDYFQLGVLNPGNTLELKVELPGWSSLLPLVRVVNSKGEAVADEDATAGGFKGRILASDSYYAVVGNEYWVYGGHAYRLVSGTWAEAEAAAVALGGHLVTIEDQAEQDWVYNNFSWDYQHLWLGLNDETEEGTWVWVDGSGSEYRNWRGGEPSGGRGENSVAMHSGGGWFDWGGGNQTGGLAEWVATGVSGERGAGAQAQYVLTLRVGDEVAPQVSGLGRIPAAGGVTGEVLGTFSVTFSEALAAETVNAAGTWDLRAAGVDGAFGGADDVGYTVQVLPVYAAGTVVNVVVADGPLGAGKYRLTIRESVTDVVGNKLDGDGDGKAGGDFVRQFGVEYPAGYVSENRDNGELGKATELVLVEDGVGLLAGRGWGSLDPWQEGWRDEDWWGFAARKGDQVVVMADDQGSYNGLIHLFNARGEQVGGDNDGGPYYWDTIRYDVTEDGMYYVRVRSHDRVGNYELGVVVGRGVGLERDVDYANDEGSRANGLSWEQSGNGQVARVGGTVVFRQGNHWDVDYYQLGVLNEGNTLELKVELPGWSSLLPLVRVVNSKGEAVADEDATAGGFKGRILASDSYYAVVGNEYWVYGGHAYRLVSGTWAEAEAAAVALGGHLVTIEDQAEQDWVYNNFSWDYQHLWLGLNDETEEGTWVWVDGSGSEYRNWRGGEPSGGRGENSVAMHSGGGWFDWGGGNQTGGLAEWVATGVSGERGAGAQAQYVLTLRVGDEVAPQVSGLGRIPAAGGVTGEVLGTFSVTFSEALAAETVNAAGTWDLRAAGVDGAFGGADDVGYTVQVLPVYAAGTVVNVVVADGPLGAGKYRLTIRESVTDVVGNKLDGDGDGKAGGDFVRQFGVEYPAGYVSENRDNGELGKATELVLVEDGVGLLAGRGWGSLDPWQEGWRDEDWWGFAARKGDQVVVMADDQGSYNGLIHLFNARGEQVGGDNDGGPYYWDTIRYDVTEDGMYYVRVRSHDRVGNYELGVVVGRGVGLERDVDYANDEGSRANGLSWEQSGNGQVARVGGTVVFRQGNHWDVDYYQLGVLNEGNTLELKVELPGWSSLLPLVRVVNSKGEAVADEDATAGGFKGRILASDSYYAVVGNEYWVYGGHAYRLVSGTWAEAEAAAVALGGHLVTIEDQAEQDWVYNNFSWDYQHLWLGLNDETEEGTWVWVDGSGSEYRNWRGGEPSGGRGENSVAMHSGGGWFDWGGGNQTGGLAEWVATGVSGERGAGAQAQYVLTLRVGDEVAPQVSGLGRIPAAGGVTGEVLGTFSVTFSEALAAETVNAAGTWDLRAAGVDGAFGGADDVGYTVQVLPVYAAGTVVNVVVADGPLGAGKYRLTIRESVTDVVGNKLDGDGDGKAGGDFVRQFGVEYPAGYVSENRDNGELGKATELVLVEDGVGLLAGRGWGSLDPWQEGWRDEDWWGFAARKGDQVVVMADDQGSYNGLIHLFNARGEQVGGDNDGGPYYWDTIRYDVTEDGMYYVRVRSHDRVGNYELGVVVGRGVGLERDVDYANNEGSRANGLSWEQSGNGQVARVGGTVVFRQGNHWDVDYYQLGVLNEGNTLELKVELPGWSSLLPLVRVVNSKGEAVADEDATAGGFKGRILASDSYYAVVGNEYWVYGGHAYRLVSGTWAEAEAAAVALGGHLVTIEDQAEQDWVYNNFSWDYQHLWLGLNDETEEGTWVWVDGSGSEYRNWRGGEPSGGRGENSVAMHSGGGWFDWGGGNQTGGLAEWVATGVSGERGAGAQAQYVLTLRVGDEVAPQVSGLGRIPAAGGVTGEVLGTFSVTFSEALDPFTINDPPFIAMYQGHLYALTNAALSWTATEERARQLGAHLVTISDSSENSWVRDTFGSYGTLWLGMNDVATEGTWVWASGETAAYTNWAGGEPNNAGEEDYAQIYSSGSWNDAGGGSLRAIMEWDSVTDTDGDGVPDILDSAPDRPGSSWDLRAAGADGAFGGADDVVYKVQVLPEYGSGTVVKLIVSDGPLAAGHYRLTVKDSVTDVVGTKLDGDGDGKAGGDYVCEFRVEFPAGYTSENRDNGELAKATELALMEEPLGMLVGRGLGSLDPWQDGWYDEDWWGFAGTKGDKVAVTVDDRGSYNGMIYLHNAQGQNLSSDNDGGAGGGDYLLYDLPEDGTYYVRIRSHDRVGNYELTVVVARGVDLESDRDYRNGSVASADIPGLQQDGSRWLGSVVGTVMGGESGHGDQDYFKLGTIEAGKTILLSTRLPSTSSLRPLVEIRDASDKVVSIATTPSDAVARADIAKTGDYYAVVLANGGQGPRGQYLLDIAVMPTAELSFADLVVVETDFKAPATAAAGQTIHVEWKVGNYGAAPTPASESTWLDRVVISPNDIYGDGDDTELAVVTHTGALGVNEKYAAAAVVDVALPKTISGVWYLFVKTDLTNAVREFIFEENNVSVAQAIDVTPTPAADLAVGAVTVSAETLVIGVDATITWRTTNLGAAVTGDGTPGTEVTQWIDRIVVSANNRYGDSDDVLIQNVPHTGRLAPDEAYTGSWTGPIPQGLSGVYHLFVVTDAEAEVFEIPDVESNVAERSGTVRILPGLFADLVVDLVTAPGTGASGQPAEMSWKVSNVGQGATSAGHWSDRVFLSRDRAAGSDILVDTIVHDGVLPVGESYTETRSLTLPVGLEGGQYYVLVQTDALNAVQEPGAEDNNYGASTTTLSVALSPTPDLVVTAMTAPSESLTGGLVTIGWTARNAGSVIAVAPWSDRVYVSKTGTLADATLIGTLEYQGNLVSGQEYTRSEVVKLPVLTDGDYRIVIFTDAMEQVFERGAEDNNVRVSTDPLRIVHPDLVIDSVAAPVQAHSGTAIFVSWTGLNVGTSATPAHWTDRLFISKDGNLTVEDSVLGELAHAAVVAVGDAYQAQLSVRIPDGLEGTYRIIVKADAADEVEEDGQEGNNDNYSSVLTVTLSPPADLAVSNVTGQSLLVGDPVDLTVGWKVTNQGTGPGTVDSWTDRVVLSRDEVFGNGDDRVVGTFLHTGAMPVGTSYSESHIIQLAGGLQDRLFLFVQTDATDVVFERPDAGPNVAKADHAVDVVRTLYADLVVNAVTVPAGLVPQNGKPMVLEWTVTNDPARGLGPTNIAQWHDRVYLGSDPTGKGMIEIAVFGHAGPLGLGDSYSRSAEATLPWDAQGAQYLFVKTEGPFEFLYTENNIARSEAFEVQYVPPPQTDLEVIEVTGPDTALDAEPVEISWRVRNNGPDLLDGAWTDVIYLAPGGDMSKALRLAAFSRSESLEAGKSYARTELVTLPNHTQGAYRVVVRADDSGEVAETNENNNTLAARNILTLTLRPRPDLQVTSVVAPRIVTSGGVIDVEFTVTNLGGAPTPTGGSRWEDAVYLSFNREPGGVHLGSLNNGSALDPGASYTTRATFKIPIEAGGDFFVVVAADSGNRVDEYPQENNNHNSPADPLTVDVLPVARPDVVMQHVASPAEAFDATEIVIRYRVANQGAGITYPGSWTDSVWLTRAKDRPNGYRGDVLLGQFGHSGALEVGEFYESKVTVRLPAHIQGQFYITVWADSNDAVFESAFDVNLNPDAPHDMEGSNFKATPISVLYTPPADLEVIQVQASPTAVGGGDVTVSWTVQNSGSSRTDRDRWADAIYISSDDVFGDGKGQKFLVFGAPHIGSLEPGESYTETATFTLPPSAKGQYVIVETNVNPDILLTEEDLFLKQVQDILARAEARLGKPLMDVSMADLQQLTKQDILNILTGGNQKGFVPVWEGPFTTNNERAAASTITDIVADLVVTSITAPATAFSGDEVEVSWTVKNQGPNEVWDGTEWWKDYVFVSLDEVFDAKRAYVAAAVAHHADKPLQPGESYTTTAKLSLPEGIQGKRYIHVFPAIRVTRDGEPIFAAPTPGQYPDWPDYFKELVWETDKANNRGTPAVVQVIYREADLQVISFTVDPEGSSGGYLPVEFTVRNALRDDSRTTRTSIWLDRLFISADTSLDGYDELVGDFRHIGALDPGESYVVKGEIRLPDNIGGNFYLLVYADSLFGRQTGAFVQPYPNQQGWPRVKQVSEMGMVHEFAFENNNTATQPIHVTPVTPPDLVVSLVTAPEHVTTGRNFQVTYEVTNRLGAGDVPDRQSRWTDYVFLSRDQMLDVRSDHYLGELQRDGVPSVGQSYTQTAEYRVPRELVGPYYVIVLTDRPDNFNPRGFVLESDEAKNTGATVVPMLIELPPPSDLQVDQVTVPDSAFVGETVTLAWSVSNHANEPATGIWADSAYLSRDGVWDLGDRLIGTVEHKYQSLAKGQSYTASLMARIPLALPGDYRVIVRADIYDDVFEGANNRNNATASTDTLAVQVKTLTLGVTANDDLSTAEQLLYRVEVLAGETLRVELRAGEGGANELYVRYEGLPDSINFDAAYPGYLWANQTATVPRTEGGTYYIMVRGQSEPAPDTPVTLTARLLPFSIFDVTPDAGGDSRYVTMKITGAKFDPAATVKLIRPTFAEFAPVNYLVVDATQILATFDLRNAMHGLYDLEVTNPDGAAVRLPYRYLVETTMPLDLTVGLGGPSNIPITKSGVEPGIYGVSLLSLTNVDTPYVHLEYGVPRLANNTFIPGERLLFSTNFMGSPGLAGVSWPDIDPVLNLNGDLIASGFGYDFVARGFGALTFIVEPYPELKNLLKENPRLLIEMDDLSLQDLAFTFYIQAAATPVTATEYVDFQTQRALTVRDRILLDPNAPQALKVAAADSATWTELFLASLTDAGLLRPEDQAPEVRTQPKFIGAVAELTAGLLGGDKGEPILSTDNLKPFFELVRAWMGNTPDAYGSANLPEASRFDLQLSHKTHYEVFRIQVGVGQLVEEQQFELAVADVRLADYFGLTGARSALVRMTGPSGVGDEDLIPLGLSLPYTISVQNPADPNRALSELRIVQQIDSDLDVRTFTLSDITLGGLFIDVPDDRGAFTGEYDFSKELGFVLQVSAGVDVQAHIATWFLRAIDPDTGLVVTDSKIGLLQPGASGTMGYTIRAMPDAANGSEVTMSARAFYDQAAPLDSAAVTNTIDAIAPTTTLTVEQVGNGLYSLQWTAQDNELGAGVKDSTVYVSLKGGPYLAVLTKTTETSWLYESVEGASPKFLVLSCDAAGNVEQAPAGMEVPPYNPSVNLGTLPRAPLTDSSTLGVAEPVTAPAVNPLFLQLLGQVPGRQSPTQPSAFSQVFEPFAAAAFAWSVVESGGGIGPLGIAFDPSGQRVLISGGSGRNRLWEFNLAGGAATTPLVILDVPIYDMVFDADGRLWATTGGGPLVRLDAATGEVLERFGDGVNLGLTVDASGDRLYVSTRKGVEIYDPATGQFTPYSNIRVDGLALAPDGKLWGTTWPKNGQVVRFDHRGRAEVMVQLDEEAEGLAFGVVGTSTENLLFISHAQGGDLTVLELTSMKTIAMATGGSRGDFLHVNFRGQVFVTQSDQVSVFFPVSVPQVIATTPIAGSRSLPDVNRATVTFSLDMVSDSTMAPASVLNVANYQLSSLTNGQVVPLNILGYVAETKTLLLAFEALAPDNYELRVAATLESEMGVAMNQAYTARFTVLEDVTADVTSEFAETRFDRQEGIVSFEVRVTNTMPFDLIAPIRIVFNGLFFDPVIGSGYAPVYLLEPDGITDDGHPYVDLSVGDSTVVRPGLDLSRTVALRNPDQVQVDLQAQLFAGVAPNRVPVFTSTAPVEGAVGENYTYRARANDPDSILAVGYLLAEGPDGAKVDPKTGIVSWIPRVDCAAKVSFELRAYDARGGYAAQSWEVGVAGTNTPPVLAPVDNQILQEGELFALRPAAFDADGDILVYGADHLPPGAWFDAEHQTLRWQTTASSAGYYPDVTLAVTDGVHVNSTRFDLLVLNVNQAPEFEVIAPQTVREGETIELRLKAADPDGETVSFGATGLPAGATVAPESGLFRWTPAYNQHGEYQITLIASDGLADSRQSLKITVLNVNAPISIRGLDRLVVFEGQVLEVRVAANDPDHPLTGQASILVDPETESAAAGPMTVVTYAYSTLPAGAQFDSGTGLLSWVPGYTQAGTYLIDFTVTDDGDRYRHADQGDRYSADRRSGHECSAYG